MGADQMCRGGDQISFLSAGFTFKPIICCSIILSFNKKTPKLLQFFLSFCWFLFTLLQWEFSRVRTVFLLGAYKTWHPPPLSKPRVNLLDLFLTFLLPVWRASARSSRPQTSPQNSLSRRCLLNLSLSHPTPQIPSSFFTLPGVSHTSEVSLAQGLQSCPAAKDNSQEHYLQFTGLLVIWAEHKGGLGGVWAKTKISRWQICLLATLNMRCIKKR